jgi:predicted nucleotidyltransferase component of viral defense system
MDNVRLRIQVDFGVGDVIVPGPRMIQYPVFFGGDTIELLAYPVETSIAEKLQAMVALGEANSRMKDFYDVWNFRPLRSLCVKKCVGECWFDGRWHDHDSRTKVRLTIEIPRERPLAQTHRMPSGR